MSRNASEESTSSSTNRWITVRTSGGAGVKTPSTMRRFGLWAQTVIFRAASPSDNRTAGSFKVTITRYDSLPSTNAYIKKAVMSGTFEGDMTCETCFDPAVKSSPFAQVQHFTAGKFENVPVIIMSNK